MKTLRRTDVARYACESPGRAYNYRWKYLTDMQCEGMIAMFFLRQPRELFEHGLDFGGRSTRLTYWLTTLWLVLGFLVFEGSSTAYRCS